MNKTSIEFCDYTWNPIVGCRIGCEYCWAKKFHARFNKGSDFSWPTFYPNRLEEPYKTKKPSHIFVCSMGDINSNGVPPSWVEKVLEVVRENPQHTFKFLSKRPYYFQYFNFPENVWLGTSISEARFASRVTDLLYCGCKFTRFVVVEPLLGSMEGVDLSEIDHVFVGAQTGPVSIVPKAEWIASVKHPNLIYKENIKKYL